MVAHAFPDIAWLKKQANSSFADRKAINGRILPTVGWPNVIMNARASAVVRDDIKGPLSLFANLSGESNVTVERHRVTLPPGVFFISNSGQYYTLEIGKTQTETVNIHFGEAFSEKALRSMNTKPEQLLEGMDQSVTPAFFNRVASLDERFRVLLNRLTQPGRSAMEEEQDLYDLLALLVGDETVLHRRKSKLTALKASTKTELMKRMLKVTDYLNTVADAHPDLDELARISCLSKFHFLRLFKIAFGQTPHQYITSIKVNRARTLLATSKADVKTIATSLGYADASTFSRAFYRQLGLYPSQYRAQS